MPLAADEVAVAGDRITHVLIYWYARPAVTEDPSTPKARLSRRTGEELPPAELRALARERSEARRAQNWAEADRLRALIEAQGWKVIDKGAEGRVVRAHPEDVVEADGLIRYGWTGAVPEADGTRDTGTATIVARATQSRTTYCAWISVDGRAGRHAPAHHRR